MKKSNGIPVPTPVVRRAQFSCGECVTVFVLTYLRDKGVPLFCPFCDGVGIKAERFVDTEEKTTPIVLL